MINYEDITEDLCIHCGECCKIYIPVTGDERYISFIREIELSYIQDDIRTLRIFLGYCPNLLIQENVDIKHYLCSVYSTRPKLCRDFNCIAWAKVSNSYEKSEFVKKASEIFEMLNKKNMNKLGK